MTDSRVVHPGTGELLEGITSQPPETLSDALMSIREQRKELFAMERVLTEELRRRVKLRTGEDHPRRPVVFGDFEVKISGWRREWDADLLEETLHELYDEGRIDPRRWTDIIRRKTEVSGSTAARLYESLGGDARTRVGQCFAWRESSSPGTVEVVVSQPLIREGGEAA